MIITEAKPEKKRKPSKKNEAKLQASIVIDFSQKRPEERGRLIGYFANTDSMQDGAIKCSLGLVKSVSDLFYFRADGRSIGIEIKAVGEYHNIEHLKAQAEWLLNIPYKGYFCDNLETFWSIINGGEGINPSEILRRLEGIKTDSVKWGSF